ncbi:MAG: zf-TFIIB domain-containing protein [Polyangiaceae bacterium]
MLICPRCDIALTTERHPSEEVELHRCIDCHGVWVDGDDIAWVAPGLRRHGARITELLAKGARRETSMPACPRGHGDAIEFPFFDLWLDLCETCHGVWLDGAEVAFVERAGQEADGLPEVARHGGAYREQEAVASETVTCVACGEAVHPRRTYLTGDGTVCDTCVEVRKMSEEMEGDTLGARLMKGPRRFLRFVGELLDRDGKRLRRGGFTNQSL